MQLRLATPADAEPFMRCVEAAGLSTSRAAMAFYLAQPESMAYVAEEAGEVVGTGVASAFGGGTGWVGVITVRPDRQGNGIGKALVAHAEALLAGQGVRSVILLASQKGRPMYEKLGYKGGVQYLALKGPGLETIPTLAEVRPARESDWPAILDLDRSATGEDRTWALRAMKPGFVATGPDGRVRGFHLPAPWGGGPAVAADPEEGAALLSLIRGQAGPGPMVIRLPEANRAAMDLLLAAGFAETTTNTFMVKGPWPEPYRPERLWGLFSFGLG